MRDGIFMKRLAIYFFYDQFGEVDRYIDFFLQNFAQSVNKVIVVCNGILSNNGRKIFEKYTSDIIVRENTGFDVWAYKTGIDFIGWENMKQFDELILLNFTVMGPVVSFSDVFSKMEKEKELDFWGLNTHYGDTVACFDGNPYGYIPKHIQSHFTVFRRKLLMSQLFMKYWNNVPEISNYKEAVGKHESFITKYFEDNGFRWSCYTKDEHLSKLTPYPLVDLPVETIKNCGSPVFKRKNFMLEKKHFLMSGSSGNVNNELFSYIQKETEYDTNLILENIIRTSKHDTLISSLNLYYTPCVKSEVYQKAIAVCIQLDSFSLTENDWKDLLEKIPAYVSVFLLSSQILSEVVEKLKKIRKSITVVQVEKTFKSMQNHIIEISKEYEFLCVLDYEDPFPRNNLTSYQYQKAIVEIMLNNGEIGYILNVFSENPLLGLLIPTELEFGHYYYHFPYIWKRNQEEMKKFVNEFSQTTNLIDLYETSFAPVFGSYWYRAEAISQKAFEVKPNMTLESQLLLLPFICKNNGFYTACLLTNEYEKNMIGNHRFFSNRLSRYFPQKHPINFHEAELCQKTFSSSQQHIVNLENIVKNRDQNIENYKMALQDAGHHATNLENIIENREQNIENYKVALRNAEHHATNLEDIIKNKEQDLTKSRQRVEVLEKSSSWKMTAPYRFVGKCVHQVLNKIRNLQK